MAANLYGIPCDEAHALTLCPPGADGTRLRDLQKAAPEFGLKASTAKLSWQKLLALEAFAILHVNGNHYVLADPNKRNGDAIRIYDHDIGARWYDQQALEAIWKGTSLVLEKYPNFEFPSLISAPTYWIDKGDFTAKDDAEYFFTIKNASAETIELKVDATSCQCSSATLATTVLEPDEETILVASVRLDGKRGGFRERVVIQSTCGDNKGMDSFILAGMVIRHDILSATRIFVGSTHRSGRIHETFAVHDPGNGQLKRVEAALREPVPWLDFKATYEKVTKANQDKHRKLSVKPDDWIITLSAEVKREAALHKFKLPIVVQTNLEPPLDSLEVSLEGKSSLLLPLNLPL